jgi:hypothetical protein
MNYKIFVTKYLYLKYSRQIFLLVTLIFYTILILKIFQPKPLVHLLSGSVILRSNSFETDGLLERDLSKNLRRDISIDATCTLPYVSRSCYALVADFVYDNKVKNIEPVSQLRDGDIIWLSTAFIEEFFEDVFPKITKQIILISYYEDYTLESKYEKYIDDERIIVWFACNPGFHHLKLIVLPIGFENTNWDPPKIKYIRDVKLNSLKPWKERKNLLYINFSKGTNLKARGHLSDYFKNFSSLIINSRLDYPTYLSHLNDSKFVLCPRGNGLDTHRFYEAILMGAIPVVQDSLLRDIFNQSTSLVLNDLTNLTMRMLLRPDMYIKNMSFPRNVIYFNTWLKKIDEFKLKYTKNK